MIETLPNDVIRLICDMLSDRDTLNTAHVNKRFYYHVCNYIFWLKRIKIEYPSLIHSKYPGNKYIDRYKKTSYKEYYFRIARELSNFSFQYYDEYIILDSDMYNILFLKYVKLNRMDLVLIITKDYIFDPEYDNSMALIFAISNNNIKMVKLLLNMKGINPSCKDNFPIKMASELGYKKITKILLSDNRIDPTAGGSNLPLRLSSEKKHKKIIKLLLSDYRVKMCYIRFRNNCLKWLGNSMTDNKHPHKVYTDNIQKIKDTYSEHVLFQ